MWKGEDVAQVVLIGTMDTKGNDYAWLKDRLHEAGVDTLLLDAGVLQEPTIRPDISREEIAESAGVRLRDLIADNDRGKAIATMAEGAAKTVSQLYGEGKVQGVIGLGGSGGTAIATKAMRALPIGVPKLMVSTVASGETRTYVGGSDICMMHSVVDIAGINSVSSLILGNAAQAMAAMAKAYGENKGTANGRPLVGASMFGVTTGCVDAARSRLEDLGYEVLVFHATGTGGQAMETLVESGYLAGVLDVTTTELADDLVGGVLSAGSTRLTAAAKHGVPQVVSLGALDMVNFGARNTVPEKFENRRLLEHNPSVTLMRTTEEEMAELGRRIASRLNSSTGRTVLFIPRAGVSSVSEAGGVFHDPVADRALFDAVTTDLGTHVEVVDADLPINDVGFAGAMANKLDELIRESNARK